MDTLKVTVVGQGLFTIIKGIFELIGLNEINRVNHGTLGNLKTLTYKIDLDDGEIINTRNKLIEALTANDNNYNILLPMFVADDWMHIFVFNRFAVKTSGSIGKEE